MDHLVQRWGDQAAQANHIDVLIDCYLQDFFTGDHNSKVDHIVIIAAEHNPDNIFADVVYISLNSGHQYLALTLHYTAFLILDIGE